MGMTAMASLEVNSIATLLIAAARVGMIAMAIAEAVNPTHLTNLVAAMMGTTAMVIPEAVNTATTMPLTAPAVVRVGMIGMTEVIVMASLEANSITTLLNAVAVVRVGMMATVRPEALSTTLLTTAAAVRISPTVGSSPPIRFWSVD